MYIIKLIQYSTIVNIKFVSPQEEGGGGSFEDVEYLCVFAVSFTGAALSL